MPSNESHAQWQLGACESPASANAHHVVSPTDLRCVQALHWAWRRMQGRPASESTPARPSCSLLRMDELAPISEGPETSASLDNGRAESFPLPKQQPQVAQASTDSVGPGTHGCASALDWEAYNLQQTQASGAAEVASGWTDRSVGATHKGRVPHLDSSTLLKSSYILPVE